LKPRRTGQAAGAEAVQTDYLDPLHGKAIWRFFRRQPASFWFLNLYLLFEYVRPQLIYQGMGEFSYTQTLLILTIIAWFLEGMRLRKWTAADTFMALYTALVLFTSIFSYYPAQARDRWDYYFPWVLVYILITNIINTRGRFLVFIGAFLLYSIKMSQHATRSWMMDGFRFRHWGATGAPGWFQNSGDFAVQMVVFVPLAVYFALALRPHVGKIKQAILWIIPMTGIIGVLGSSSRGGQLGAAMAVGVLLLKSRLRFRALASGLAVAVLVVILLPQEQRDRFTEMGEDDTSISRLTLWEDGLEIMREHPVFGIGYGNWIRYYRTRYNPQGQVVHNIFLEAGAEMGYTGLLLFLFGLSTVFILNFKTRRVAGKLGPDGRFFTLISHGLDAGLAGFMVSGFFVTVLYYPFFWIQLSLTVACHMSALNTARRLRAPGGGSAVGNGRSIGTLSLAAATPPLRSVHRHVGYAP